ANDATVALAELVAGSEEGFVKLMNEKAEELNMKNTVFQNATGLDAENHYSTARDIAIMGNALLSHEEIKDYSTVWMDELRQGKTQLVNTNKLIRFYKGTTGLKTGTTDGAGSCLCATATRNNLPLIAVTMGSDTSDNRFNSARGLLDYGFSNFEAAEVPMPPPLEPLKVTGGLNRHVGVKDSAPPFMLLEKGTPKEFKTIVKAEETLTAPVAENQKIGRVKILQEGVVITEYDLLTSYPVEKITFKKALKPVIFAIFCM
ncbi:MAG: D-alanyl-D-alanine carboxypeptidase, partial [Oscillospiraceae bacterium]